MMRIDARALTLRYGQVTAVDGIDLSLDGGRIYGLLGRNGSGKTSLLSVLAGFRKASAGSVHVDGHPVFDNPAVVRHVCLIREGADTVEHDWPADRVDDALAFGAALRPNWDPEFADRLVDQFDLPRRTRIGALSRGQRSALAVTLGLASRAPITMFDEAYLGMDAPSRYAFYDALLADVMEHPRTVIISTHLIEEVSSLFEEIIIIDQGRLLLHDDADAVRARGATLTGPTEAVERLTADLTVLGSKQLGPTTSVTVYGGLDRARLDAARSAGVEVGPVALQDLFVHLTSGTPAGAPAPAHTGGGR